MFTDLRRQPQQILRSPEIPHHEQAAPPQIPAQLPRRPNRRRPIQRRESMAGEGDRQLARHDCSAHTSEQHANAATTAGTDAGPVLMIDRPSGGGLGMAWVTRNMYCGAALGVLICIFEIT